MNARIASYIVTLGPVGYFHAPGTVATLVSLPLVYWMHWLLPHQAAYLAGAVILYFFGSYAVYAAREVFNPDDDAAAVVIDELVGCVITFWGVALKPEVVILGFLLFRFFDIAKVGGVAHAERLRGVRGVMLDDVLAAFWSNICLRFLFG